MSELELLSPSGIHICGLRGAIGGLLGSRLALNGERLTATTR